MIRRELLIRFGTLALAFMLSACATTGGDDSTGNLGVNQRESPAQIYVEMGIAYMRDGQDSVALKKLRRAIEVDPRNSQAHNVLGILYERLGESELATKHYDRAAAIDPRDPYIRNARGSFFCKQGQYVVALEEFELALDNPLYPTPWVALTNAGLCAKRAGKGEESEKYLRHALSRNPRYSPALLKMAERSYEQENHLSARAYLERFHSETDPTAASLWLGVRVEKKLGARMKSIDYKRRLLKEFPDSPEIQELNHFERQ